MPAVEPTLSVHGVVVADRSAMTAVCPLVMDSNLAADSAGEAADQVSPTPQIDQKYRLHLSQTTILVIFFLSHFSCVFMLFHVLPILVNKDVCFHTVIWLFHHVYE